MKSKIKIKLKKKNENEIKKNHRGPKLPLTF